MKYNGRLVLVPWLGEDVDTGETTRNWSRLRFIGPVDHRRVKRELRKTVKKLLGRSLNPIEQRNILKHSAVPLYEKA